MTDEESFLAAIQAWAQKALPAPPSGHGGPECQWCPLCQLASVLRGEHPELTERMSEAGAAVGTAVRALLDSAGARAPGRPAPTPTPTAPPTPTSTSTSTSTGPVPADQQRPQPRPRVQRIVLDDETPKG